MNQLGLTSVTFRALPVEEIIRLAKEALLDGIEWGGDIHVPPANLSLAREVRRKTEEAGLRVLSYGSYYAPGQPQNFDEVLETACALNAPLLRVWAGRQGSGEVSAEVRRAWTAELKTAVRKARDRGVTVGLEYHRRTLTDTRQSALALLEACEGLRTYWQPNPDLSVSEHLEEIRALKDYICQVHVFAWEPGNLRQPLAAGEASWKTYFAALAGLDCPYVMEFVKDDSLAQFREDAAVLKSWTSG